MAHLKEWSPAFAEWIAEQFPDDTQASAARELNLPPSAVHYYCNGARPRESRRKYIARKSRGRVPADLPGRPRSNAAARVSLGRTSHDVAPSILPRK